MVRRLIERLFVGQPGVLNPEKMVRENQITDFDPARIQGNSIDLRIKSVFRIDGGITLHEDNTRELPPYVKEKPFTLPRKNGNVASYFRLDPQHLYQVEFFESVNLSKDVCALTFLRSSMFKSGASGETGLFDSGYSGGTGMTINVKFQSDIEVGSAIAQLVFFSAISSRSYSGFYRDGNWKNLSSKEKPNKLEVGLG